MLVIILSVICFVVLVCSGFMPGAAGGSAPSAVADSVPASSRETRRLVQISLNPSDNLQTAVDDANAGDTLVLAEHVRAVAAPRMRGRCSIATHVQGRARSE